MTSYLPYTREGNRQTYQRTTAALQTKAERLSFNQSILILHSSGAAEGISSLGQLSSVVANCGA